MSNLTIFKTSIRKFNDLYSLNDLHIASGSNKNHQPAFFIRNSQTQELIAEIERSANSQIAVKTVRGGRNPELQGTWACEELALAYATWISPKFHLVVLRAFIAMHKGETLQKNHEIRPLVNDITLTYADFFDLAWAVFSARKQNELITQLVQPLELLGSNIAPMAYSHSREYQRVWQIADPIVTRILKLMKDQGFNERHDFNLPRLYHHFGLGNLQEPAITRKIKRLPHTTF